MRVASIFFAVTILFGPLVQSEFTCPKPNGAYPYPGSCNQYWSCYNSVAFLMKCQPGFYFDPVREICERKDKVDCPPGITPTSGPTTRGVTTTTPPATHKQTSIEPTKQTTTQ